eukprot:4142305-Amphidinium_carterae.1
MELTEGLMSLRRDFDMMKGSASSMPASGGNDSGLPKWVLNVDFKVVHKIVVSGWEVPCEQWRAACGWQFGRLGKFALVIDASSGKK